MSTTEILSGQIDTNNTNFISMGGTKRRRNDDDGDMDDEKTSQTSKCKGSTTIPIFLKKTYKMIDTCDHEIASWTADGDMFVVKDPDMFASAVIPQYFDHNKFSSFARQLNFYGFRKMQSKPIRNSDFDANTAKHVTFFNENFKRGRCDLLKKIQRSTRGGGNNPGQDQQREIQTLREKVATLETTIGEMGIQMEERMRRLELDMLGRMEQMMLAMQQQQQISAAKGANVANSSSASDDKAAAAAVQAAKNQTTAALSNAQNQLKLFGGLDPLPYGSRATSIGSIGLSGLDTAGLGLKLGSGGGPAPGPGPTLPPHPKQKQLGGPGGGLPGSINLGPTRLASLGLSNLARGISSLSRGASIESQSSALLNNAFEDKFLTMLMQGQNQGGMGSQLNPTPMADNLASMLNRQVNAANAAAVVSNGGATAGV
jgi:hypothetical protein